MISLRRSVKTKYGMVIITTNALDKNTNKYLFSRKGRIKINGSVIKTTYTYGMNAYSLVRNARNDVFIEE